jgi:hypothetical protein
MTNSTKYVGMDGATDGVCYHPSLMAINDVSSAYLLGSTNSYL